MRDLDPTPDEDRVFDLVEASIPSLDAGYYRDPDGTPWIILFSDECRSGTVRCDYDGETLRGGISLGFLNWDDGLRSAAAGVLTDPPTGLFARPATTEHAARLVVGWLAEQGVPGVRSLPADDPAVTQALAAWDEAPDEQAALRAASDLVELAVPDGVGLEDAAVPIVRTLLDPTCDLPRHRWRASGLGVLRAVARACPGSRAGGTSAVPDVPWRGWHQGLCERLIVRFCGENLQLLTDPDEETRSLAALLAAAVLPPDEIFPRLVALWSSKETHAVAACRVHGMAVAGARADGWWRQHFLLCVERSAEVEWLRWKAPEVRAAVNHRVSIGLREASSATVPVEELHELAEMAPVDSGASRWPAELV